MTNLTRSDIEAIIQIVKSAEDIEHFSLSYDGVEIRISRRSSDPSPRLDSHPAEPTLSKQSKLSEMQEASKPPQPSHSAGEPLSTNAIVIKAPMVGTFYRSPAPGEPPFVEIGEEVEPDTVICIIEVMKLMNSISAGSSGTIKEILVDNAEPVEFGQPLVVIEPKT